MPMLLAPLISGAGTPPPVQSQILTKAGTR